MSKIPVERKPSRKQIWRVSWNDRWGRYQPRDFTGRNAEADARAKFAEVEKLPKARLECNGVWVAGDRGLIAVPRDGRERESVQGVLTLEGE